MVKVNPTITWLDGVSMKPFGSSGAPAKLFFSSSASAYEPVLADTDSVPVKIYVVNNFTNGTSSTDDCYDIKKCKLTTKAIDGTMDSEVVKQKWMRVKNISVNETSYTSIGADETSVGSGSWTEVSMPIGNSDGAQTIAGSPNGGDINNTTDAKNTCQLEFMCHPILTASAGKHSFLTRIIYVFGEGI